ncbi:hypothetical protein BKA69DRAFT_314519 [Paraphysoderma sedebokerense]|nr:hypothetical protein BKA69DRAFT_314519 [Paraphysoderma sedebokerense]
MQLFSSLDNSGAYSPASNIPDIVTLHNLRNSIREEVETELAIEKAVARKRLEIDEFVNKAGVASYYDRNRDANHSNSEVDLQLTADQANMGLFSSSETSDNISSNALLLANFDSASPARERRRHSTAASMKRERYIPFSDRHGASLTYQNLEGLDYSNNRNEKGLSAELPFQNLSMNANREENTFRTCELRLSERVPKGRIDIKSIEVHIKDGVVDYTPTNKPLIVENRNVVTSGKSISESVSSNPNSSAPFTRVKEVEELFDSVMKGMGGDHLKCVEGPKARLSPAATFDSNLPIPPAFLCRTGIANVSENESPPFTPVRPTLDKTENRVFEHKIQLLPRRPDEIHVTADEFIVDRERAMAKVPSSKLSSFKYNFGGYIPQATVKVKKEAFALNEFWDYMQTKTSDFLLDILKDRFAARFEEAMKLSEQKKAEESDSGKTVKAAKVERKKVVLPRFEPGAWSPAFLDYMKLEISRDAESEKVDVTQNSLEKIEEHREESVEETEVRSSSQSNYPTDGRLSRNACESTEETTDNNVDNRSQSVQYEPSDNPPSESPLIKLTPQERLENIWDQLHIDDGARLDMAMRYGSDSYVLELASLLALWEDVTRAIIEREAILHELRLFELDHSDPERLFMPKATAISWKQETERREELLQKLEKSTETVKTTISELDQKWPGESEKVTFKGKKYLDKFRKDYSELQYEVSLIRGNRKNANNQSTPVEDSEEGGTCG